MKATQFSKEPYFPMLLCNGRDAVVVDYSGNGFHCVSGHTHPEQNQGVSLGWYKASSRFPWSGTIQPLFNIGIRLDMFGAPAEPRDFKQRFFPKEAVLKTELQYYTDVRLHQECFLNDEGIFCQRFSLENPNGRHIDFQVGTRLAEPSDRVLAFRRSADYHAAVKDGALLFTYGCDGAPGEGFQIADREPDEVAEGMMVFRAVKDGFSLTRFVSAVDARESPAPGAMLKKRRNLAEDGWDALLAKHKAVWKEYFETSSLTVPDEKLQYVYDLSRYVLRAAQHPDSGMIGLGMLPSLWGGALYDTYDEMSAHAALLTSGNLAEGRRYLNSYVRNAPFGKKILSEAGIKGTAFGGWDDCEGRFTHRDFLDYTTRYKPSFTAFMLYAAWYQKCFDPESFTDDVRRTCEESAEFLMDAMVVRNGDDWGIRDCSAGNESGFMVKVDTFNQMAAAQGLRFAGSLLNSALYREAGDALYAGLDVNYDEDGFLRSFKDAPFVDGLPLLYYWMSMPDHIGIATVTECIRTGKTAFGIDSPNTSEEYRHWPWCTAEALLAYSTEGMSSTASEFVIHLTDTCSSLGALPEKIRLDGFAIGYWYTSAHAFLVWALNNAVVCLDRNTVRIAGGFDERFGSVSATGIRLANGLSADVRFQNGTAEYVCLKNGTDKDIEVLCSFMEGTPVQIWVQAGKSAEVRF